MLNLRLSSRPDTAGLVRAVLGGIATPFALRPELLGDLKTVVSEACNNAVEHAYRDDHGSVHLAVDEDGSSLRATIRDRGRWRDRHVDGDRGRGILIMESLMTFAEIRESPGGTDVVLERRLSGVDVGPVPR